MPISLRIFAIVLCLFFFIYVVKMVSKEKLLLRYSLVWLVLTLVVLFCAIFPEAIFALATLVGFHVPSNFIFFLGLFLLLSICLSLSLIVSKNSLTIKNLTQHQALLEKTIEDLKKELEQK